MNIFAIILSLLFGILSGVLGGLGMGGGTLLIPLLTIFLNFEQKLAQGINLLSSKMIGIYLFTIGIIVLMHQNYVLDNMKTGKIFTETIDYLMLGIERIMNKSVNVGVFDMALSNTGGGLLGAIFSSLFYSLFEAEGTKVVVPVLLIAGFMIFTGLSIKDICEKTKSNAKELKPHLNSSKEEKITEKDEAKLKIVDHNDEKIVVHDIKE